MADSGTFNVSRTIWGHEVFRPAPFSEREAFLWLISEAAWKPRTKRAGNIIVDLQRGQLAASVRFMAQAWGWKKDRVSRYFNRLKTETMIATDTATGVFVITLCNYESFQSQPGGNATGSATGSATGPRQHRDKPNKGRREEEEEEGGGGSARATDDPDLPLDGSKEPALLDRVIEAAQIDIQRDRSPQRWFGSEPRHTIAQWQGLGLTDDEIVETVSEVIAGKHDGPPAKLSYFNPAMQRRAGRKVQPDLTPINGGIPHDGKSARERRAEAELEDDLAFARDLDRQPAGSR